jgi:hypothetical protein
LKPWKSTSYRPPFLHSRFQALSASSVCRTHSTMT